MGFLSFFVIFVWNKVLVKSPRYTRGDFMFLYRFVRRRRRPQLLVHAITFEQLFGFLSFLAQLLALTCRLPDYILVDFRCDHDLDFSRSNMEFAISQPKMVRLPRNEKQTYRLNSRAKMWPSGLTLAMTLTLNFQGQIWNLLYLNQKWSDCHRTKSKHTDWTPRPQMWLLEFDLGHDLHLEFSRSNMEFPISQPKVVRLPRNEKQTYRLNSRPQMWPTGWTLTIILTFEIWRSNVTSTFDHTHDLGHGFSWSNF